MKSNSYILIIDDSNSSLLLMEWLVLNQGFKAELAESVSKAIPIIKNNKPGLILLDLQMPDVSGYDFLKMRESLNITDVPIIVVSAYDTKENIDETLELGATEFMPKPIKTSVLIELVNKYLQK